MNNRNKTVVYRIINITLCILMFFIIVLNDIYHINSDEEVINDGGKHNSEIVVDLKGKEEGYSAIIYNNLNGLPTSEANDIVQTSDGFIWIGSYGGLIRYDGNTFERMNVQSDINNVKCLYVDSKDRLWIGSNSNGIALFENGVFRKWDIDEGIRSSAIRSIVEDNEGNIYIATTQGLLIFDQDLNFQYFNDLRIGNEFLDNLKKTVNGDIYGLTNSGDVFLLKNGKIHRYYSYSKSNIIRGIEYLFPDPKNDDLVYFETMDGIVYHGSLSDSVDKLEVINIEPLTQIQNLDYFDGDIWVCARNGIGVLDEDGMHVVENIPMDNTIGNMMTDYEGNLWFTSTRQGVMEIVPNRFMDLFGRYNMPSRVVNSTCMYDDKLFIGTDSGLMVYDQEEGFLSKLPINSIVTASNQKLNYKDLIEMLDNVRIRSIIRDSKDRIWISTWRKYGLLCYDKGDITAYTVDDGLLTDIIRMVKEKKDGTIIVAGTGGICIIDGDKVVKSYDEEDGITNSEILNVEEGKNGDILVGTDGAGIFVISDSGTRHIGYEDGLSSGSIMRIKYDEKHNIYWVVTGDALVYLDENYEVNNIDSFPSSNNFDIYFNNKNELWVLSGAGIFVADIDSLLKDETNVSIHYSMSNGLPCIATANSYSELDAEGNLYIAGNSGVARINIEETYDSLSNIRISVPFVEIDGKAIYPDEDGKFRLPSDFTKLAICGKAFTYSLSDPIINCELKGFDTYKYTGTVEQLFPVYYTNLPGGTYEFNMNLIDSMNNISKSYSVEIIKEKAIFEQAWFYLLCALSGIIILFALVKAYINRRLAALEKKHHEEEEKKRISKELSLASRIQQSMLPHVFPPFPDRKEFDIYASMDPAKGVGGDFYDFFLVDEDHLCLIMADVSGKGIPGALFMATSKTTLQSYAKSGLSAEEVLDKTNRAICSNNQEGMFVTVWIGILEISTGKMYAANAGHEYPALKNPDSDFELLKDKHGFVLGGMDGMPYHQYEVDLSPGSKLFLYTDGIPEATDSANNMFGTDRMIDALNTVKDGNPVEIIKTVKTAVDEFVDEAEQFDDVTMLCFEYKGNKG